MTINAKDRKWLGKKLAKASRSSILDAMSRLAVHWQSGVWLPDHNPYKEGGAKQIRDDINNGREFKHSDLSEYVAASAIIHCFDGWSYLGRALEAEMAGDPDTARHLGYYAELRAAMSMLASEGIGVFDDKHIVITDPLECISVSRKNMRTHRFTWFALEVWSESMPGINATLRSIRPGGYCLSEWLRHSSAGSNFVATNWLREWGLDLGRLASDRDARNQASYNPTAFTSPGPRSIRDTMETILQFWEICDPGINGDFPSLDRYLLRQCLNLITQSFHSPGRPSSRAKKIYTRNLESILGGISPQDYSAEWWADFLSYENLTLSPKILDDARGGKNPFHVDHSKQVLARATLLLRVATGGSRELLKAIGAPTVTELDFWRSSASVRRKLWPKSNPPPATNDLWLDVSDALHSIEDWLDEQPNEPPICHHALWTEQASAASALTTTERVFLWGVGL